VCCSFVYSSGYGRRPRVQEMRRRCRGISCLRLMLVMMQRELFPLLRTVCFELWPFNDKREELIKPGSMNPSRRLHQGQTTRRESDVTVLRKLKKSCSAPGPDQGTHTSLQPTQNAGALPCFQPYPCPLALHQIQLHLRNQFRRDGLPYWLSTPTKQSHVFDWSIP